MESPATAPLWEQLARVLLLVDLNGLLCHQEWRLLRRANVPVGALPIANPLPGYTFPAFPEDFNC